MTIDSAQFVAFIRGLVDDDPRERWSNAEAVTDLRLWKNPAEGRTVAVILAALVVWEQDPDAREAQLHALAELHEWGSTSPDAIDLLSRLDSRSLAGSEVEYLQFIVDGDGPNMPTAVPSNDDRPSSSSRTDVGYPLTFDEMLARVNHAVAAGKWQRRRAGRFEISLFRRDDAFFALPVVADPNSSGGWLRRDLPAVVIARTATPEALGAALFALLSVAETRPGNPNGKRFPILRQARISSWRQLSKTSDCVDVSRRDDLYLVYGWVRDLSRLDGYQVPASTGHAYLERPTPWDIGSAVIAACDAVHVQGSC